MTAALLRVCELEPGCVSDLSSGRTADALNPINWPSPGRCRKLFSRGPRPADPGGGAPGRDHRLLRRGSLGAGGWRVIWSMAGGDLTFGAGVAGWRRAFTAFDHNDAKNLGTALLTPRDPLQGSHDALAFQCGRRGIRQEGDVVRGRSACFTAYGSHNGNLLIPRSCVNAEHGRCVGDTDGHWGTGPVSTAARSAAFRCAPAFAPWQAERPSRCSISPIWDSGLPMGGKPCTGTISGTNPPRLRAPLSGSPVAVRNLPRIWGSRLLCPHRLP